MKRSAIDYLSLFPRKLGIEQMNNVPGKFKISYLLGEKFERPLNIPKLPSIENISILYNYGPGVRGTKTQRPVRSTQITMVLLSGLLLGP